MYVCIGLIAGSGYAPEESVGAPGDDNDLLAVKSDDPIYAIAWCHCQCQPRPAQPLVPCSAPPTRCTFMMPLYE